MPPSHDPTAPGVDLSHLNRALAGRYAIESEIDTGGMATVYRACDLKHDRTVAIKVLRPDLTEAIGADRFLKEIRTTANLSHPHILPLFDSGEAGGYLYYVMPFVKGESLRDRLKREAQLPVEDAIQIAREVADALAYAHRNGVIHRDIKPANVMLDEGHALLADFGIAQAKAGADETRLTGMGMSLGTPTYMSPEQISGEGEVDGRTDQYALACVLYEMLAGHPPFTGTDIRLVMRQHLAADAPKVTGARASVPTGVAKAIHRGLAKIPADRYRTVSDFEKALAGATLPWLARIPMGRARVASYAVAVALLAAAVVLIAVKWAGDGTTAEAAWKPDPNVIAAAPFQNLTGDPAYDQLGERLAVEVQRRLSGASIGDVRSPLRVLPALWAAGAGADPLTVLSEGLGAGTVVTGIIELQGDSLAIHAYCTDARTGADLAHVPPVRGHRDDPEPLTSRIGDEVAGALALRLDPDNPFQSTLTPPLNPEAYAEYRRGVELVMDRADWGEAADHYLRAWALDSTYFDAGVAAFVMLNQSSQMGADRWEEMDSVLRILDRSMDRLTPSQQHTIEGGRAIWLRGDAAAALREARLAAADDSIEEAYTQAHAALWLNYTEEAVRAFRRWEKGDGEFLEGFVQYWPYYFHQYGDALHRLGRHDEELRIVLEGHRRFPNHPDLIYAEAIARIGLGQVQEARPLVTQVRRRMTTGEVLWIAQECFAHGLDDLAVETLEEELQRFDSDPYYEDPRRRAEVLHMLGRDEEAFAIYQQTAAAHPNSPWQGLYQMGIIAPVLGDTALALEIDRRIAEWPRNAGNAYSFPLVRAQIEAALGNREEAFRLVEESYFRYGRYFRIENHAIFDLLPLQGYPPYDQLMKSAE